MKEDSLSFYDIIEKIHDKGLIYGVYVTSDNEKHNSLSLAILNNPNSIQSKTFKSKIWKNILTILKFIAHINMIVDDAIDLIGEHFKCYMSYLHDLYDTLDRNKRQQFNVSQYSTRSQSSCEDIDLRDILNQY